MHYENNEGSRNGEPTIEAKVGKYTNLMGKSTDFTQGNRFYFQKLTNTNFGFWKIVHDNHKLVKSCFQFLENSEPYLDLKPSVSRLYLLNLTWKTRSTCLY